MLLCHTQDCWRLLDEGWRLKPPALLLSITGAAKNFHLEPWMRNLFRTGLAKAAGCSNAWVITGGTKSGVMQLAWEALGERSTHTDSRPPLIGIAPWGWINESHREQLMIHGGDVATLDPSPDSKEEHMLDPNHTHFMLVDDGGKTVGGEIQLRNALEQHCCRHYAIPLVTIVLQGGIGTFKTVVGALQNDCQAIFLADSGGCAGIVAQFIEPLLKEKPEDVVIEAGMRIAKVDERLKEFAMTLSNVIKQIEGMSLPVATDWLREIGMHLERINIYYFGHNYQLRAGNQSAKRPLDQVILDAYTQSFRLKTERTEQDQASVRKVTKLDDQTVGHVKARKNHPRYAARGSRFSDV